MNEIRLYQNNQRYEYGSAIENTAYSSVTAPKNTAVETLPVEMDQFIQSPNIEIGDIQTGGYEKFSACRLIRSEISDLSALDLASGGVPNPIAIFTALDSLQNDILNNKVTETPKNLPNLIALYKQLAAR